MTRLFVSSRGPSRLLASAAIGVALSLGSVAQAQPGGGGGPGGFRMFGGGGGGGGMGGEVLNPSISSRDLERAGKILSLDKDQTEAAKMLFDAYQEQYKAKAEPLRKKMERAREEFRESRDPSVWGGLRDEFRKLGPVREEMEKTLFADLKAVLREDQAASWEKFERSVRRERSLNRGLMSGERVNLIQIVERAELDDESKAKVAPVLDQYEVDLDRALTARTQFTTEQMSRAGEIFGGGDPAELQKMIEKGRQLAVVVRDVNKRYARQVEDLVPEDKALKIAAEVRRQSFPRVFETTRAQRLLDAAAKFEDLDENQKASVASLRDSYVRDAEALNDQMTRETEKFEMSITAEQLMGMFRGGNRGPVEELFNKRGQLGRTAEDNLRKILSPEQQKRLPEDGGRDGRDRGNNGQRRQDGERRRDRQTNQI